MCSFSYGTKETCISKLPDDLLYILEIELNLNSMQESSGYYAEADSWAEEWGFTRIVYLPNHPAGFTQIIPVRNLCLICYFKLLKKKL